MIRLWNRVGGFRMLAVFVLVLGIAGGAELGSGRQTQQRITTSSLSAQSEADELRELHQIAADGRRVTAVSRAAQREAQAKADAAASAAAAQAKAADDAARKAATKPSSPTAPATASAPFGPIPASCAEYSGNQAIGCTLMLQWGFGLDQMPCLKNMWMKESGWNPNAHNSSSGAHGIPQSLPASKMAVYGADYMTNPATQIKWGLDYIKGRYKTPCGAWSFWQSHHYY